MKNKVGNMENAIKGLNIRITSTKGKMKEVQYDMQGTLKKKQQNVGKGLKINEQHIRQVCKNVYIQITGVSEMQNGKFSVELIATETIAKDFPELRNQNNRPEGSQQKYTQTEKL